MQGVNHGRQLALWTAFEDIVFLGLLIVFLVAVTLRWIEAQQYFV